MKKLFLVGAVALFGAVNAQEYKPGTGDVTTEFGLKGGLGDTGVELPGGDAYFKARYFKADNIAYRATLSLKTTSNTKDVDSYSDEHTNSEKHTTGKDKKSSMGFTLGFGLEKHFKGTERLSPYVGGEFLLGYSSKKESSERTTVNSGDNKTPYKRVSNGETKGANGFSFGVRGVFGADYYFTKRVFLGVEAGLSLMYGSEGKTTTTSSYSLTTGGTTVSDSRTSTAPGSRSFGFSPSVVTGIRLGYAF
ncbi:hypothetical protein PG357_03025 [Riemerella anatipestifer]|uniref:hypothetical protein n=1 Tax=Riemerella anatipestifer TaxID=34085 RepID=UPI00069C332B|nr:hypothetical protein [Riemerella anatipestifer]MDY3350953.1 hypothetical protein [Riemerella anatipestifer]